MDSTKIRTLSEDDILSLEIGAAILGTGGGGNPYLGRLRAVETLRQGHRMSIIPLHDLPDTAQIVAVGGVGAPVVSVERIKEGQEGLRALRALEAHMGFKADAIACQEIGGANAMEPLIVAALAGLPVVDCDGMGRAFPEMQMTTYSIYGHSSTPSAMSDPRGNTVVFAHAIDEHFHERMVRASMISQGGSSTLAIAPMSGRYLKKAGIPDSYTKAIALGRTVLSARAAQKDVIATISEMEGSKTVFAGKIVDISRDLSSGFVRGSVEIEGFEQFDGATGTIELQNEYLAFRSDGGENVLVPDLIVVLDADDGSAISTEMLRYGQRIAVMSLPAHPLLRTKQAMDVIGPNAFGLSN